MSEIIFSIIAVLLIVVVILGNLPRTRHLIFDPQHQFVVYIPESTLLAMEDDDFDSILETVRETMEKTRNDLYEQ